MSQDNKTIMIVDDEAENLRILEQMLQVEWGNVVAFPNGEMALEAAQKNPPDLVLLDIRMPGMSGFSVCDKFKENDKLKDIPVIFLSALSGAQNKVFAFEKGAVDYITKPLQEAEVLARVRTHIKLVDYQNNLKKMVKKRTETIEKISDRLHKWDQTKNIWLRQITKNLQEVLDNISETFNSISTKQNDIKDEYFQELVDTYEDQWERIENLMNHTREVTSLDPTTAEFDFTGVNLDNAIGKAIQEKNVLKEILEIKSDQHTKNLKVPGPAPLIKRALLDIILLIRAFLQPDQKIYIYCSENKNRVKINIQSKENKLLDKGIVEYFEAGIMDTIDDNFQDLTPGIILARNIIELLNGNIVVTGQEDEFIKIIVVLPKAFQEESF
ncbi:MAG TPA: response regulator [bacterium]|nr:response regulator [bacterium]